MSFVDNCSNCNLSPRLCKCHSIIDISPEEEEWDFENPPPEQVEYINSLVNLAAAKQEALNMFERIKSFCGKSWIPIMDNLALDDIYDLFYSPEMEFEDQVSK